MRHLHTILPDSQHRICAECYIFRSELIAMFGGIMLKIYFAIIERLKVAPLARLLTAFAITSRENLSRHC